MKTRIGIFASGEGTNAENLFKFFAEDTAVEVGLLLCNRPQAGVLLRARRWKIPIYCFKDSDLEKRPEALLSALTERSIDWLVLAGFLRRIPVEVIKAYQSRILNIHPALLPKYGGKGMYGRKIHEAVLKNRERKSGITIHKVDENYDKGKIVRQVPMPIDANKETVESLLARIRQLEHQYYPRVICEQVLLQQRSGS